MDASARAFEHNASRFLAAAERGETITVTRNGRPVARLVPYGSAEVPSYPPGPIGDIELPQIDLRGTPACDGTEADRAGTGLHATSQPPAPARFPATARESVGNPTYPAPPEPLRLPPMRTIGELRAALALGHGYRGDAGQFEAELARELHRADPTGPVGLSGIARLVEEFRGRVADNEDPAFGTAVAAAVVGIRTVRNMLR
ncbi:type II toxin-antitoxin system prevent-host-death family antitoxin [Streptomyces xinghaiensis]|uniref:type II toxin-antitoxin system Phd/YefM family antitoxin n=1 Tax=Streptomyces xinghaiensis TaxID=1038928 RepID=UPI002E0FED16|nr:type II toxin-antitoxin system prevent-host-death family antitoxin [Streptomyces xinghaiensis]